jgi:hypothetical protein
MNNRNVKQVRFGGECHQEAGRAKGEGEGGWQIWSKHFIPVYENRIVKPVGIVLRGAKRERQGRVEG